MEGPVEHNGLVIGGPGHGQTHDPERIGPVLIVPKPQRLPVRFDAVDVDYVRYERVEYRLHQFSSTDGSTRFCHRVWLPSDVKTHEAFGYVLGMVGNPPA